MERLIVDDDLEQSVLLGKHKLSSNDSDVNDAALLFDGRITFNNSKLDAIIIEVRCYFSPESEAVMAIPYTPKAAGQFRVHKPKLLAWNNCEDFEFDAVMQAFFDGVDAHEEGAAIWNQCLDESI